MIKKLFFFTLSSLWLLSCNGGKSFSAPAGIIQPDTLVEVLTDVHIFQATIQLGNFQNDSAGKVNKAFEAILKKHRLSDEEYNRSLKFYSYRPDVFDDIYEKVLNNLSQQKAELMGKKHT
jgi:hypothetical protein